MVENKYRFNMFWDLTNDRGMFTLTTNQYWQTAENGYVLTGNPLYLNYSKQWNELKKIRGRNTSVFLRKNSVLYNSMTLYVQQSKNILSPR